MQRKSVNPTGFWDKVFYYGRKLLFRSDSPLAGCEPVLEEYAVVCGQLGPGRFGGCAQTDCSSFTACGLDAVGDWVIKVSLHGKQRANSSIRPNRFFAWGI